MTEENERRLERGTSSASYAAMAEPAKAANGKLIALCATLGAVSIALVIVGQSVPAGEAKPRVAKAPAEEPAQKPAAAPAPKPVVKAAPLPAAKPLPARTEPVPLAPAREEPPAPAPQEEDQGEIVHLPPLPAPDSAAPDPEESSLPPPGPAPSPMPGGAVSEVPVVAPGVESPLGPSPAPRAEEKLRPGEKIERFEDGSVKARYMTDSKGQRSGSYVEFHQNGRIAIKATYKAGKLHGTLTEGDAKGKVVRRASYKNGLLHGELATADSAGKITSREVWFEGKLLYPKTVDEIERKLAEIASEPLDGPAGPSKLEFEPYSANGQIRALRRLRAYRYLCDVPYDVTLSLPYSELCTAASQLLEIIGHLDHTPPRPNGVPDSLYIPACEGLVNGNLHEYSNRTGDVLVMGGVDMWIWDSDRPKNIVEVGHRRTSLNPRMKEVAYGARGHFTVMYSHDAARPAHARDFVAYPSRGYFPISYLMKEAVWSCAFDNDRYRLADDAKVEVRPADAQFRKGEPVELHDVTVENKRGFAEGSAMIWKPDLVVSEGARYWITIKGVTDLEGKPVEVEYLVEFIRG